MQVVQLDAIEGHLELRPGVQTGFLSPPVESVSPVLEHLLEHAEIRAGGPGRAWRLVGQTRSGQTVGQVSQVGIRNVQLKWLRRGGHGVGHQEDGTEAELGTGKPESYRHRLCV